MKNTPTRQLAAILFADIVGYTSMMQADEGLALEKIKRYQAVLETAAETYHGKVLKNYGDGSLMTFSNSVDAVKAAIQIQEQVKSAPVVPLRIGIHIGEFVIEKGDIYGNGVNLASRIESLGIDGAVLFSKNIYQKIKNYPEFEVQSLGSFEFKNVEEPMEVFALANEGMVVPEESEIKGKVKLVSTDSNSSFFERIWQKRIPQILIAYIATAWIGLQLFDWALSHFGISPNWGEVFFIVVLGVIPSLLVYLNNKERIQTGQLRLSEKLLFPANFIILGTVLFFVFRTADLGATTKNVTYENADGAEVTQSIVKDEFRKRFVIFPFDMIEKDSANAWYGLSIGHSLGFQLDQNIHLYTNSITLPDDRLNEGFTASEKMDRSKIWSEDYYVDGQFQKTGSEYVIIPAIRNRKTSNLIKEKRFTGEDYFSLVDSVSLFIKQAIGLTKLQIESSPDLKMSEWLTDNMDAYKHYAMSLANIGDEFLELEKAIALDSTFAEALGRYAFYLNRYSRGKLETKLTIDQAMRHRKRLNINDQIEVMVDKHLIYKEWDKAEQLLKIQLELEPNNESYNSSLSNVYGITGQMGKLVSHTEKRYTEDPNPSTEFAAMMALLMNGEPDEVISRVKTILLEDQQDTNGLLFLALAYIHNGDFVDARSTIEKITLLDPDVAINVSKNIEAIDYLESNPITNTFLSKFVGVYRSADEEMLIETRLFGKHIYSKADNQGGFFMYPAGENIVKVGFSPSFFGNELLYNSKGAVYAAKVIQGRNGEERIVMTWKQDSLIWKAEALLQEGNYTKAQVAYGKAIEKHPEHYYLYQAQQHLDYLQSKEEEAILRNLQKMTGQYGEVEIWLENGLLYYKEPGVTRRIFRPISDKRFTTLMRYSTNYEFVEKDGKIVAIQSYTYNDDTKEWEINPDWYYERTELLD